MTNNPNLHIVYADDSDDDVFIFKHIIHNLPLVCSFKRLRDGRELVDYLTAEASTIATENETNPYVVFLDLNMPRMNGFKVLEEMKELLHSMLRNIKIVVISSSSRSEDIEKSMLLGVSDYLVKLPSYEKMANSLKYIFNQVLAQRHSSKL
ncbi:response regulator [Candidatus Odyssella thessalonicensis]|uniref:response regulator n=1 Tax=Candidatus Odyssella thessalonicensis TaxID=84647 RepID=UPI000225B4E1|nr:response regulator [Candidatus Odyssella thessalonicensis]